MEQSLEIAQSSALAAYPARPPRDSIRDPDAYEAACAETDLRLKNRFEAIFAKYEHDFSNVGDEIDLETLEVVVDNGHLEHMENEADPGDGGVGHLMDWNQDDDDNTNSDSGSISSDDEQSGETDIASTSEESSILQPSRAQPPIYSHPRMDLPVATETSSTNDQSENEASAANIGDAVISAHDPLAQVPALKKSMDALQASAETLANFDAVKAFGANLIAQIDNFMKLAAPQEGTNLKRPAGVWDYPEIPALKRQRVLPANPNPPPAPPITTFAGPQKPDRPDVGGANASLWAPVELPPPIRRRKKTTSRVQEVDGAQPVQSALLATKTCQHCGIRVTSHWRRSDVGDLCNACGMFYWRYGEMKPLEYLDYQAQETEEEEDQEEGYAANTSRPMKQTSWTTQDDALIIKLKEVDRYTWDEIGAAFPNRGPWAQQARYDKALKRGQCAGRAMLVEQGFTFPLEGVDFTAAEEKQLMQLKNIESCDWDKIAQVMPKFSVDALKAQHAYLLAVEEAAKARQEPKPARVVSQWAAGEDEAIIKLHEVDGLSFEEIAKVYPGRTRQALQKRYCRNLVKRKKAHEEMYGEGSFVRPKLKRRWRRSNRSSRESTLEVDAFDREDTMPFSEGMASDSESSDLISEPALERGRQPKILKGFDYTAKYRSSFSSHEDAELKRLRWSTTLDWSEIALRFPNRTIDTLKKRCGVLQTCQTAEEAVSTSKLEAMQKRKEKKSAKTRKKHADVVTEPIIKDIDQAMNLFNSLLRNASTRSVDEEEPEFDILTLTSTKFDSMSHAPSRCSSLQPSVEHTSIEDLEKSCAAEEPSEEDTTDPQALAMNLQAQPLPAISLQTEGQSEGSQDRKFLPNESSPAPALPQPPSPIRSITPVSPQQPSVVYGTPSFHNVQRNPYFFATPVAPVEPELGHMPDQPTGSQWTHAEPAIDPDLFHGSAMNSALFPGCRLDSNLQEDGPQVHESSAQDRLQCEDLRTVKRGMTKDSLQSTSLADLVFEAMTAIGRGSTTTNLINRYVATHHEWYTARVKSWKRHVRKLLMDDSRFRQLAATRFELAQEENTASEAAITEETQPPRTATEVSIGVAEQTSDCDDSATVDTDVDASDLKPAICNGPNPHSSDGCPDTAGDPSAAGSDHAVFVRFTPSGRVDQDSFRPPVSPNRALDERKPTEPMAVRRNISGSPISEQPSRQNFEPVRSTKSNTSAVTSWKKSPNQKLNQTCRTKARDDDTGAPTRIAPCEITSPFSKRAAQTKRNHLERSSLAMIPDSEAPSDELSSEESGYEAFIFEDEASEPEMDSGIFLPDPPMRDQVSSPSKRIQGRKGQTLSSKIAREPLSSSPKPAPMAMSSSDSSHIPIAVMSSSPPRITRKSPPKRVYRKDRTTLSDAVQTPTNAASAFLANRRRRHSSTPRTPMLSSSTTHGGSATRFVPGSSTKRVVETPLRDMTFAASDEDELA